jgi:hypothetical protein
MRIDLVVQRHNWDCAVASLAMLMNLPYEEVLAAAARVAACERGLYLGEIIKVADSLGVVLKKQAPGRYNPLTSIGILRVYNDKLKGPSAHVVVLWEGRVLNPSGYASHVGDYLTELARRQWRAGTLLVKE